MVAKKVQPGTAANRSDVQPRSAECRLGRSGFTADQLRAQGRKAAAKMWTGGVLVINLGDPELTISQHGRAVALGRELFGAPQK